MLTARKASSADIKPLASRLRAEDVAEVRAASGHTPVQALSGAFVMSDVCYSVIDEDDQVVAMFGVAPFPERPGVGIVWFLSAPLPFGRSKQFVREGRAWIAKLHDAGYPLLTNFVDKRNVTHVRWLKAMGVNFVGERPFGVEQRPFMEFIHL